MTQAAKGRAGVKRVTLYLTFWLTNVVAGAARERRGSKPTGHVLRPPLLGATTDLSTQLRPSGILKAERMPEFVFPFSPGLEVAQLRNQVAKNEAKAKQTPG